METTFNGGSSGIPAPRQQRVEEFFTKARTDVALFRRLASASDVGAVIRIAREAGFVFSASDLAAVAPRFAPGGSAVRRQRPLGLTPRGALDGIVNLMPPDGGGDGGGDPLPGLNDITVLSFRVTPNSIFPGAGGAVVSWSVDVPSGLNAEIRLNDGLVNATGSVTEDPVASTTYWLTATHLGSSRSLGAVDLFVDNTGCTTTVDFPLSTIEVLSAQTAYVVDGFRDGVSYEASGVTATATMNSLADLTVVDDRGLVLFTINLSLTIAGIAGGSVTSKVWIRPYAFRGGVEHLVDRSDTSYTLPPAAWTLVIVGGPLGAAFLFALTQLIQSAIDPKVSKAIGDGFSAIDAFFHHVVSVAVVPASGEDEAVIRAVVRKAECL